MNTTDYSKNNLGAQSQRNDNNQMTTRTDDDALIDSMGVLTFGEANENRDILYVQLSEDMMPVCTNLLDIINEFNEKYESQGIWAVSGTFDHYEYCGLAEVDLPQTEKGFKTLLFQTVYMQAALRSRGCICWQQINFLQQKHSNRYAACKTSAVFHPTIWMIYGKKLFQAHTTRTSQDAQLIPFIKTKTWFSCRMP